MNKIQVNIPEGTKYISDLPGYQIPEGKCIIDKKVCGCGYTQFCLTNWEDVILCSPRISLLQNKAKQNPECYYFKPLKLTRKELKANNLVTEEDINQYVYTRQLDDVKNYLVWCRSSLNPLKFMVTYDSLPKLFTILSSLGEEFTRKKIVVDEFQLIFTDARFKAGVELDFVKYLDTCPNVAYLSSTPMLDNYLSELPEFSGLDYYEFVWDMSRISLPKITHIRTDNLEKSALEIIDMYRSGNGPTKEVDGVVYQSKEAVIFANNVSMITSLIKNSKLTPDEVNIITAQTPENLRKIKKCGKGFDFGEPPLPGEPHKLITLCTSTAFCGVDMYSTNAKSFVFSNCNLKTMAIDISLELPQIVGRQRLSSNVFRYDVTLYYSEDLRSKTEEEFKAEILEKEEETLRKINIFARSSRVDSRETDTVRGMIRTEIERKQYSDDYCSIDRMTGQPVMNNLVKLSDIRAWELQHYIYNNDVSVLRVLEDIGEINKDYNLSVLLENIASEPYFEDRLRLLAEYLKDHPEDLNNLPEKYGRYFKYLTFEKMSSCGFRKDKLDDKIRRITAKGISLRDLVGLSGEVYSIFKVGTFYTRKEAKIALSDLFKKYEVPLVAKASHLDEFFDTNVTKRLNQSTQIYESGFKLLKIKN